MTELGDSGLEQAQYLVACYLMDESDRYRKALERIAGYDASRRHGRLDEWVEAAAFHACRMIAVEALDPQARTERIAQRRAEVEANLAAIRALNKGSRYWLMIDQNGGGYWVTYLKGDPNRAHNGIVRVKISGTGAVREVNCCWLRTHGSSPATQPSP